MSYYLIFSCKIGGLALHGFAAPCVACFSAYSRVEFVSWQHQGRCWHNDQIYVDLQFNLNHWIPWLVLRLNTVLEAFSAYLRILRSVYIVCIMLKLQQLDMKYASSVETPHIYFALC